MSHTDIQRARLRTRRGLAVAIVASIALPLHNASAQIGGLVRKARDKAIEQQVEKRTNSAATSNAATASAAPP